MRKTDSTRVMGKQMIRSVTSTTSNYRAACVARLQREFFSKMSIVVKKVDEILFWLEMFRDANYARQKDIQPLIGENL